MLTMKCKYLMLRKENLSKDNNKLRLNSIFNIFSQTMPTSKLQKIKLILQNFSLALNFNMEII